MSSAGPCLISWIGNSDLEAAGIRPRSNKESEQDPGPIWRAVREGRYRQIFLISDWRERDWPGRYAEWLSHNATMEGLDVQVVTHSADLVRGSEKRATDYGVIYDALTDALEKLQRQWPDCSRTYLVSAGTGSMHAVWLLVSRMTAYRGDLIETGYRDGNRVISLPFDIYVAHRPPPGDDALAKEYEQARADGLPADYRHFARHSGLTARQIEYIHRFARTDFNILLLGETGTGKSFIAREIANISAPEQVVLDINCAALPLDLLEAELFGWEKGAFTGATNSRPGLLEQARGGTVFLDEIGELNPLHQAKLLTVIEQKSVRHIGGSESITIDCRFIFGTNRDLASEVSAGRFREDLYYRIARITFTLPPLREHAQDIAVLAGRFLDELNQRYQKQAALGFPKHFTDEALDALKIHRWPGNIRELESTVGRAAIYALGNGIGAQHIREAIVTPPRKEQDISRLALPLPKGQSLTEIIRSIEKDYYRRAMDTSGNNQAEAARLLGITSDVVKRRLRANATRLQPAKDGASL